MRTITEFSGFALADALKKMKELGPKKAPIIISQTLADTKVQPAPAGEVALVEAAVVEEAIAQKEQAPAAEAAPANDISAKMGEAFKMEGDKLAMFLAAIDVAAARPQNIKRVIVMALNEGEAAPQGATVVDGKVYQLEHFYTPQKAGPKGDDRRGGRDGKRGGKGGGRDKGRGGKGGGPGRGGPGAGKGGPGAGKPQARS